MKKVLKILGLIVGVVVLLLLIGGFVINSRGIPSYEVKAPEISVEMDSASVANGERIVTMVCAECHRGKNTQALAGKKLLDIPSFFGEAFAPNITQDKEHGIGNYTPGEIMFLLKTGIKRDGQYAPPYMPKFNHMADEDMEDVIAYLQSDAKPVQPDNTPSIPCKPSFMTKLLCNFAFVPVPYSEKPVKKPSKENKVAFGKYIVHGMVNCYDCHSADFKTNDPLEPTKSAGYMGGGNKLLDLEGNIVFTPNITMDKESGLGSWTEEEFIKAVKYGQRPNGGEAIQYPMLKLTQLTNEEVSAIWAYLQTVPEINNEY